MNSSRSRTDSGVCSVNVDWVRWTYWASPCWYSSGTASPPLRCDPTGRSQSSQEDCELLVAAAGYQTQSREATKEEREMEGRDGRIVEKQAHWAKARGVLGEQNQVAVKTSLFIILSVFYSQARQRNCEVSVVASLKSEYHGPLGWNPSTGVKLCFNKLEYVL